MMVLSVLELEEVTKQRLRQTSHFGDESFRAIDLQQPRKTQNKLNNTKH